MGRRSADPLRLEGCLPAVADFPGAALTPQQTQWALAASAAMKLLVRQEGWYRVSFAQLAQAGFTVRQPKFLQLYVDGRSSRSVTPNGIEFYATGVDTQWTDTRVYWLVKGFTPGKTDRPGSKEGLVLQDLQAFPTT